MYDYIMASDACAEQTISHVVELTTFRGGMAKYGTSKMSSAVGTLSAWLADPRSSTVMK
jgi:hypothetical protein